MGSPHFTQATFDFLRDLAANNRKDWFEANKTLYRTTLQEPAMRFVSDFAEPLQRISRHFRADPRPVGGSLFRIYRDTRFSKNKSPYKTHIGIQFRHDLGKDVHAPGYYVHLEPGNVFVAAGIWHPDASTLKRIRDGLVEDPAGWKRTARGRTFAARFDLSGESLTRAPAGYAADHPLVEDLRRKDFIGVCELSPAAARRADFLEECAAICRAGAPLVRYLCKTLDVPF
jgi:uncharacterized protein (TIGR02453 family)